VTRKEIRPNKTIGCRIDLINDFISFPRFSATSRTRWRRAPRTRRRATESFWRRCSKSSWGGTRKGPSLSRSILCCFLIMFGFENVGFYYFCKSLNSYHMRSERRIHFAESPIWSQCWKTKYKSKTSSLFSLQIDLT
jgi:hypothetical protein